MTHAGKVEGIGNPPLGEPLLSRDFEPIVGDVAGVLHVAGDLLGNCGRKLRQLRLAPDQVAPRRFRALQQLAQTDALHVAQFDQRDRFGDVGLFQNEPLPALLLDDADSDALGDATLTLWPKITAATSPADNAAIVTSGAAGLFRLTSNEMPWQVNEALHYAVTLAAISEV